MPVAHFGIQPGSECRMVVHDDQITALAPQELGILIPFEFSYQHAEGILLKWDISYLYAELWAVREDESRLIVPSLPEFTTDSFRPSSLRIPLPPQVVAQLEKQRHGGDLHLALHIQATLVGTVRMGQVQDPVRREILESAGLDQEIFGPIRRSNDVAIRISKSEWKQKILPQWDLAELQAIPVAQRHGAANQHLDIHAVARSLRGATTGADLEEILNQFDEPIVGL